MKFWRYTFSFLSAFLPSILAKEKASLTAKENVNLCVKSKVSTFTNEVQKLGIITGKNISLGPNYKDE